MAEKSIYEMSDEEFAQMNPPEIVDDEEEKEKEEPENTPDPKDSNTDTDPKEKESSEEESEETENKEQSEEEPNDPDKSEETEETESEDEKQDEDKKEEDSDQTKKSDQSPSEIDYKAFYDSIMGPIKANGKTFQARSAEEAVRLMQMGMNYTQKMQHLAPYRKRIQMLQNAGLLEDEKLNYLIDLAQGNPEAIKKLLKDKKLDPLEMNLEDEPKYVPGNHTVTDAEVQIQTIVDDLKSTPQGLETLRLINGWDQASLGEVYKTPSMIATLHEQRQSGVYDFIMKEMEHQKMLGNIPEGTPFLEAYKAVGDYCLRQQQAKAQQQTVQNLPNGTLHRKQTTSVNTQVKAAAPSNRSKKPAQQFVDPFSLSDEEFEKQFKDYRY